MRGFHFILFTGTEQQGTGLQEGRHRVHQEAGGQQLVRGREECRQGNLPRQLRGDLADQH